MKVSIAQWNKYKNRISDELYGVPYDWLSIRAQLEVIAIFKNRLADGSI